MQTKKLVHSAAIRAYVIAAINDPDGQRLNDSSTEKEKLQFFFDRFDSEYSHMIDRKGIQGAMSEYLMGLPSTIDIAYTYFEIEKLLREWEYLNDNSTQAEIDVELSAYWTKVGAALCILARRNKVID